MGSAQKSEILFLNFPHGRKVFYTNKKEGLQIVVDVKGLYCRLRDLNNHTRRPYLDINGNNANNYTDKSGKTKGRSKEDYEKVTHFRIFKNKDKTREKNKNGN